MARSIGWTTATEAGVNAWPPCHMAVRPFGMAVSDRSIMDPAGFQVCPGLRCSCTYVATRNNRKMSARAMLCFRNDIRRVQVFRDGVIFGSKDSGEVTR